MEKNVNGGISSFEVILNKLLFDEELDLGVEVNFEKLRVKPGLYLLSARLRDASDVLIARETAEILVNLKFIRSEVACKLSQKLTDAQALPLIILPKNCLDSFVIDIRRHLDQTKIELLVARLDERTT